MKKIVLVSAIGMLFSGLAISQTVPEGYVTVSSTGKALKSGTGLCWHVNADKVLEKECGDIEKAVVVENVSPSTVAQPKEVIEKVVVVKQSADLKVDVTLLFPFDSSVLSVNAKQTLKNVNDKYLLKNVKIEGYTDHFGSNQYNKKLSERRAQVVKSYLKDLGVPNSAFVSAVGLGKSNPVVKCDPLTVKCEQDNRRTRVRADVTERQ